LKNLDSKFTPLKDTKISIVRISPRKNANWQNSC